MSKRYSITTITPVPDGLTRRPLLSFLHNLSEIVHINPLVISSKRIPTPPHCPPEETSAIWFQLQDKLAYLPTGKSLHSIAYTAALEPTPTGLKSHIYAPMGVDIRSTWILAGRLPGELPASTWVDSSPEHRSAVPGLYLREDVEYRCNVALAPFVKKTLMKSHEAMTAHLQALANRPRPSGPDLSLSDYERAQNHYNQQRHQQREAAAGRPVSYPGHTPVTPIKQGNYRFEEYKAPALSFEQQEQQQQQQQKLQNIKRPQTGRRPATSNQDKTFAGIPGYSHGYSQSDDFGPGTHSRYPAAPKRSPNAFSYAEPSRPAPSTSVFTAAPQPPVKNTSGEHLYSQYRAPVRTFTADTMDSYTSRVDSPSVDIGTNDILISALSPPNSGDQPVFNLDAPTPISSGPMSPPSGHHRSHSAPSPIDDGPRKSREPTSAYRAPAPQPLMLKPAAVIKPEQQQTPLLHNNLYLPPPPPRNRVRSHSIGRPNQLQPMASVSETTPVRPMSIPVMSSNEPWVADDAFYYEEDSYSSSDSDDMSIHRSPKPFLSPLIIPKSKPSSPGPVLVSQNGQKAKAPEPYYMAGLRLQQQFAQAKPVQSVPVISGAPPDRPYQHSRGPSSEMPNRRPNPSREPPAQNLFANASMVPAPAPPAMETPRPTPLTRGFSFAQTPTDLVANPEDHFKFRDSPSSTTPTLRDSLSTAPSPLVAPEDGLALQKQLETVQIRDMEERRIASQPSKSQLRYPIEFQQQYSSPERSVGFFPLAHKLSKYARDIQLPFHGETPDSPGAQLMEQKVSEASLDLDGDDGLYPQPLRIEKWMASVRPASVAMVPPLPDDIPVPSMPAIQEVNTEKRVSLLKPSVSVVSKYPHAKEQDYTDIAVLNPYEQGNAERETHVSAEMERRKSVLQLLSPSMPSEVKRMSWVGDELFVPPH